nr:DNA mismatch repair protein MSH1, mitochondrial isoform X1 [Ipomoea batatas]GMD65626.1 DNA mismatch repair protein MSH1, mitochondrial isoform X1 [Ipomoea batatas]GMD72105.1 DNA mismatch repair protein MSH1, mitochondrial isoform X1 [Ipomoea batatas]
MSCLAAKNVVVSVSRWRYLPLFLRQPLHRRRRCCGCFISSPLFPLINQFDQICCFKERKLYATCARKPRHFESVPEERNCAHIMWWKEIVETLRKPSSIQLVKRLTYSNLLGLNSDLRNGSLKEGTLNWDMLQFKSRFPREVLLCRVGEFYEAIGFDACILVEYAGLNPFGGLRSDSIPKAGCPVMNLRQTLDDLTSNGFSVCIVEEVQGPTQARSRKSRFISGYY